MSTFSHLDRQGMNPPDSEKIKTIPGLNPQGLVFPSHGFSTHGGRDGVIYL
jgi:hypothetical protein